MTNRSIKDKLAGIPLALKRGFSFGEENIEWLEIMFRQQLFIILKRAVYLFLIGITLACQGPDSSETSAVLHTYEHWKWKNPGSIPVCWLQTSKEHENYRLSVKSHVQRQFDRTKGIRFTGWTACSLVSDEVSAVRIHIQTEDNDNSGSTNLGVSFIGNPNTRDASLDMCQDQRCTMMLKVKKGMKKPLLLNVALHEFGHASGLHHEHQRVDATCDRAAGQQPIPEGDYIKYFGDYEPRSVMNYCTNYSITNNLSSAEIEALDFAYPEVAPKVRRKVLVQAFSGDQFKGQRHHWVLNLRNNFWWHKDRGKGGDISNDDYRSFLIPYMPKGSMLVFYDSPRQDDRKYDDDFLVILGEGRLSYMKNINRAPNQDDDATGFFRWKNGLAGKVSQMWYTKDCRRSVLRHARDKGDHHHLDVLTEERIKDLCWRE